MRFIPLVLLAASCLAPPAFADSLPSLVPSHDVSGAYVSASPNDGPTTYDVAFSKASGLLKIASTTGDQGYVIYNTSTQNVTVVMPQLKQYMDISAKNAGPGPASRLQALQQGATTDDDGDKLTVTREGSETVAGHDCDDYKVTETDKTGTTTTSTVCITGDGVLLSSIDSDGTTLKAQSVSYDAVPASAFSLPAGYSKFAMPSIPGMSGGAMPGMPSMPGMGQ